jgi:hypothetical protein
MYSRFFRNRGDLTSKAMRWAFNRARQSLVRSRPSSRRRSAISMRDPGFPGRPGIDSPDVSPSVCPEFARAVRVKEVE